MSVHRTIRRADSLLPGTPAPKAKNDRRWQAILRVGAYVESNPDEVWQFVRRWGTHKQTDLRNAIACCLLEHLLEYHFDLILPRVKEASKRNKLFADTCTRCWKFGQARFAGNSRKFDRLQAWCRKRAQGATRTSA
jgi:hypothetical protein